MRSIRKQLDGFSIAIAFVVLALGFFFAERITAGIIAAAFFALALSGVYKNVRLSMQGRLAAGRVVDHEREEGCFFPVVEFLDKNGALRREVTQTGRGVKKPPVGSHVDVIYDPQAKIVCEINTFWRRWGFTIAFLVFGLVFATGAMLGR